MIFNFISFILSYGYPIVAISVISTIAVGLIVYLANLTNLSKVATVIKVLTILHIFLYSAVILGTFFVSYYFQDLYKIDSKIITYFFRASILVIFVMYILILFLSFINLNTKNEPKTFSFFILGLSVLHPILMVRIFNLLMELSSIKIPPIISTLST